MARTAVGWSRNRFAKTSLVPVALLLLLCTFVFVWRLGDRDLWSPDETRNAQVAREVACSGQWRIPTLNGIPCPDRPPLHFWCIAAANILLGADNEVSARLPGALAATGIVLLIFLLGRRTLGARAAILSGAVFATAIGAIGGARIAAPDMLLGFFLVLAMLAFLRALDEGSGARWFVLAGAAIALGMLTGGITALFVPFGGLMFYALLSRRATLPWCIGSSAAAVFGVALCIASLALAAHGTNRFPQFLASQFHGLAREEEGMAWRFLWAAPLALMPWVFFVPGAVAQFLRDAEARRGPAGFFLSWTAFAFLWTVVFGTRNWLLALAVVPPMAGLVGIFWDLCLSVDATERLRFRVGLPFLLFVLFLPVTGFTLYGWTRDNFESFEGIAMGYSSLLIFMASVLVIFIFWRQTQCRFASLGFSSLIAVGVAGALVVPRINELKSEKKFFETVRALPAESELRTLSMSDASHLYYAGRSRVPNLQSIADLKSYFASEGQVYCIMDYDEFLLDRVRGVDCLNLVYQRQAGHKKLAIVTNRPR